MHAYSRDNLTRIALFMSSNWLHNLKCHLSWWRHQMETFSALLAICSGNSPVTGEFPAQRAASRSFDVFFYPRLNKWLSEQSRCWWFETSSRPLWRHYNVFKLWLSSGRLTNCHVVYWPWHYLIIYYSEYGTSSSINVKILHRLIIHFQATQHFPYCESYYSSKISCCKRCSL